MKFRGVEVPEPEPVEEVLVYTRECHICGAELKPETPKWIAACEECRFGRPDLR